MSATSTQIYLTHELRERIDRAARAQGVTMSEVIRAAVDRYLAEDKDPSLVLAATFGRDPSATAPARDEWARG